MSEQTAFLRWQSVPSRSRRRFRANGNLAERGLTPRQWYVVDMLAHGGVMTAGQLGLPPRTLRHYARLGLVRRLDFPGDEVREALEALGWPADRRQDWGLWTLGPAGRELALQRWPFAPMSGYEVWPLQRVLHDVVVVEIGRFLAGYAREQGWEVFWAGTNAAELRRGQEEVLEPDSLMVFRRGVEVRAVCIEYHNERGTARAREKVRRYERAFRATERWQAHWDLEDFPVVLAVAHDPAVLRGYLEALRERRDRPVTFYGKVLSSLLQGNVATWKRIDTRQEEPLLPVPEPA